MLGLSQLYQLRGRVGRSSEQAYAYLLTSPFNEIKEVSLKRLRALQQYTDLGSGFQIAMRDLEIRGAGNILGADQHGHIAAVGFDLYCRLLKEEIDRMRGKEPEPSTIETKIDLPVNAYIPTEYIAESAVRVALYQQCSRCKEHGDIEVIEKEFYDRFGPIPEPVRILLLLIDLKILAQRLNISHISLSNNILSLAVHGDDSAAAHQIQKLITGSKAAFEVVYGASVVLKTELISKLPQLIILEIRDILTLK
jgi:transcription-repair coupling factor (superfamily II helicase)